MQEFDSTFFSRISSGISIELKAMDLKGRIVVLDQMFRNTGFGPGTEIITYLATEITQNIRTLKAAGRAVLAHLLASPAKGSISIETVQNLLSSMNLRNISVDKPLSPDRIHNSAEKNEEALSPYIVVDIDDEVAQKEQKDELIFKNALEAKRALAEKKTVPSETTPQAGATETEAAGSGTPDPEPEPVHRPVISPVIHAQPETETAAVQTKAPVSEPVAVQMDTTVAAANVAEENDQTAEGPENGKERSIHMLESATTVNSQIEALKMAALRRIEQLEKKNPDSPEIAKLRFAIVFLNEGKIESAMLALK